MVHRLPARFASFLESRCDVLPTSIEQRGSVALPFGKAAMMSWSLDVLQMKAGDVQRFLPAGTHVGDYTYNCKRKGDG
ncbi:hypothetical protein COCON_G00210620 [Conger conger]|uniref:Uncharacterized protein n=1 Tax=Conger conger TaxID=82655 RepID=A0A9Q1HNU2_CONCO|nr:hypothetical protein COCON_G00210620 [Conger conger]